MLFGSKKNAARAPETTFTLHDVAPDHAAVSNKLKELCGREDAIAAEMREIWDRVNRAASARQVSIPDEFFKKRQKPRDPQIVKVSDAASSLLGDLAPPPKTLDVAPATISDPDYHRLQDLGEEHESVREAISALRDVRRGERFSAWERTHLEGSKAFCQKIAPEYADVARDYLDALIALGNAQVALDGFVKKRMTGVAIASIRPVTPALILGDPRDPHSPMRQLLRWAVDIGRLDPEDVPTHWNEPEA